MAGGAGGGGGAGGDEAAWRELIAHYTAASAADEGQAPWPERENLATPGQASPVPDPGPDTDPTLGTVLGTALGADLAEDRAEATDPGLDIDVGPDLGARVVRPARPAPAPQEDDGD